MLPLLNSKLPNAGTTIFTTMSSLAVKYNAINLGQGFPDYPMNKELISLVNDAMKKGFNQYVHMNGYLPLREAIAEKISYLYNREINPETEITITPGGTYALFTALTTILKQNDEVIVFEPAYDSYIPAIELNGAKAVSVELEFPNYKINWETVKSKLNANTRAIIINSPHNPTGSILSKSDMDLLEEMVRDKNIFIISDEVYEHLIFDSENHESILKYPSLYNRSIVCFSFGKVYNCTGWKLGYCIAPDYIMKEIRKVHQFNCFTCDTPKQVALSGFMKDRSHYLELGKQLQQKRDYFSKLMSSTKFEALSSSGSYFQVYSYRNISDLNEREFAIELTKNFGVATIPVSAFYSKNINHSVLRFCFSKQEKTLEDAVNRLIKV